MWNATWHNFNVILLNCGMNIQIQKIQDKSSCWHKNDNTSSILTKKLCLLKITWPKKVIPTKSYSLAMLYLHHTKYLNHAQPRWQAKQLFYTFDVLKLFQSSRNTWAWAMDIALWVEYNNEGVMWRRQKRRKSHINEANQWAMEMPINRYQCEWVGIAMQRMH